MTLKIDVEWTGRYPNLCSGQWKITVEGKKFNIPDFLINHAMGTFKTFQSWHFENWMEVFESYQDGLEFESWIKKNAGWIKKSFENLGLADKVTMDDLHNLYNLINENDFRSNSCGGCI